MVSELVSYGSVSLLETRSGSRGTDGPRREAELGLRLPGHHLIAFEVFINVDEDDSDLSKGIPKGLLFIR